MATFRAYAKQNGIKYFLISFVDLFGTMRAKLVPATAIDTMAKAGAGFAGFAVWFDMTPAHADILVMADLDTAIQLPWKPEVAWVTGDLMMDGKPVAQNPRQVLKRLIADAASDGYDMKTGVECEYFMILPDGSATAPAVVMVHESVVHARLLSEDVQCGGLRCFLGRFVRASWRPERGRRSNLGVGGRRSCTAAPRA